MTTTAEPLTPVSRSRDELIIEILRATGDHVLSEIDRDHIVAAVKRHEDRIEARARRDALRPVFALCNAIEASAAISSCLPRVSIHEVRDAAKVGQS